MPDKIVGLNIVFTSIRPGKLAFHLLWMIPLFLMTFVHYLLFHVFAELFSIVVALSLFIIAFNSRKFIKNPYLSFIGPIYLFIAIIDLMHTLTYKGMHIIESDIFFANQLWIGGRFIEAVSLLIAFYFLKRGIVANQFKTIIVYSVITAGLMLSVFGLKNFPACFIEGEGQTAFKIYMEYIIILILALDLYMLNRNRDKFDRNIFVLLFWTFIFTMLSELSFTFYISNYGLSNLMGHYFKLFSFILIYQSIIQTGIQDPFRLIFKELNDEIEQRTKAEEEKKQVIEELQEALREIKTLQGIIPVCMHCKKVRDDGGYWTRLEDYLRKNSEIQISHGLCPDCLHEHYPDVELDEKADL